MPLGTAVIEAFQSFGVDCKLACLEISVVWGLQLVISSSSSYLGQ